MNEALAHRPCHFAQARGLRCRQAERPCHPLLVESPHETRGRRCAECAGGARDVPVHVVRGIDRVCDAAFDVDAENEGVQERAAAERLALGQRKQGRDHGRAGMKQRAQVRVVEVQDV
jgi:hypothetical protein